MFDADCESLLQQEPDWVVVAEASNGREAVRKVEEHHPDVVIIDLSMPEMNGLTATKQILHAHPKTEVVLLTMHDTEQAISEVLQTGARGYVLKSDAGRDLVTAVRAVRKPYPVLHTTRSRFSSQRLFKRQQDHTDGSAKGAAYDPRT